MGQGNNQPGIAAGRLSAADYAENFSDLHPPLTNHEAIVESDRCYFCHDAPCMTACPTSIDIPLFIRQIQTGNPEGSAKTIFDRNILGGICARVCPTETLCEQVCVRNESEGKPVKIGQLQRFATDHLIGAGNHPYARAAATGRSVAVVGAGPAGLACAHALARLGHDVTIFDARDKAGGLNEYGIAAYKTIDDFAQREVEFILSIGGIKIENGTTLGVDVSLTELRNAHDAVFLGMGLAGVNGLGVDGEALTGVEDAVDFIAQLRQANDLSTISIGRKIVVIGGGMTAIDAAAQSKLLGAEDVTIAYRRGQAHMNASDFEQELAQVRGVKIKHNVMPVRLIGGDDGNVRSIELEYTSSANGRLEGTGETFQMDVDMVFKAIGQTFAGNFPDSPQEAPELERGRIKVDADRRTSLDDVWAGGDCVAGGDDLTVAAVEDGKLAAQSIHRALSA